MIVASKDRTGFALFAAMFVLVVVSGLTLDLGLRARAERAYAWNAVAALRARAAARAGVAQALARLRVVARRAAEPAGVPQRGKWSRIATVVSDLGNVQLGEGTRYSVEVHDIASRLPLNEATAAELRRFFSALGAGAIQADVAAQSTLDWRDEDELHRARGAEWDDFYRVQQPTVTPRNGPFGSIEELRQVRGIDDELYHSAAEHVTLFGDGRINLNTAPEPVLRALAGMTDEVVALLISRRVAGRPIRNLFELQAAISPSARAALQGNFADLARRASFEAKAFEISATGWTLAAPIRSTVRALAVRNGATVQVVWSVER